MSQDFKQRACNFGWPLFPQQRTLEQQGPDPPTDKDAGLHHTLTRLAYRSGPLRRFGASSIARLGVLAIAFAAMTAYTVPDLAKAAGGCSARACGAASPISRSRVLSAFA